MAPAGTVIWLLRRDLRVADNPILHHLATSSDHGFAHFLPVYVFPAQQIELSGFLKDGAENPFPPAKSHIGGFWRCGPHRARFIGQAVWDTKTSLEALGSGLVVRVGMIPDVVRDLIEGLKEKGETVTAVWMTSHEGVEERRDEKDVASLCEKNGAEFKIWVDEKYFIDDRDVTYGENEELPNIFTKYRLTVEPLRERPRAVLAAPTAGSLPSLPNKPLIPTQSPPFRSPETQGELLEALLRPVKDLLPNAPPFPEQATSAHPFDGGETTAIARLKHLIKSGAMNTYHTTRNELVGTDFSTKLSAFLAQGCITARQIHHMLLDYENGTNSEFEGADGYGSGKENKGTETVRFELLWRDYMRLCHVKFKHLLFRLEGFGGHEAYKDGGKKPVWKFPTKEAAAPDQDPGPERIAEMLERFKAGTTGMGLIDASQRELLHTGYTSNRARQNVASFLAKHLGIDWRYGAEWYEMLLIDYDVSSNWGNWQYVSGVGNDPRGEIRIFNPVKQAFDYDKEGDYVRQWVPEASKLQKLENVFQAWTASEEDLKATGLEDNIMVTDPVKRIEFSVDSKPPKPGRRPFFRRRGKSSRRPDSPSAGESTASGVGGYVDVQAVRGGDAPVVQGTVLPLRSAESAQGGTGVSGGNGNGYQGPARGSSGSRSSQRAQRGYQGQRRGYYQTGRGPGRGAASGGGGYRGGSGGEPGERGRGAGSWRSGHVGGRHHPSGGRGAQGAQFQGGGGGRLDQAQQTFG